MKCIVLIAAVLVAVQALTDEQKAKVKQYHTECSAASGVDESIITKARQGDFTDDAKFKDHLFCFSKKAGFQNEAGDIQTDVLKAKLTAAINDEAKATELITKCAVKKDTPQITAYETIKCYYEVTHQSLA